MKRMVGQGYERPPQPSLGSLVEQVEPQARTSSPAGQEESWALERRHSKVIVEDLTKFLVGGKVRWVARPGMRYK